MTRRPRIMSQMLLFLLLSLVFAAHSFWGAIVRVSGTPPPVPLLASPLSAATSSGSVLSSPEPGVYTVSRVVDGDTLVLDMNGMSQKVRLIGLDTPEVVDPKKPVQCYGEEASVEARLLLEGKAVRIELDATQGVYDRYQRLLAYVFLPDGSLFEEEMIRHGFGREYTYEGRTYKYQQVFKAAEVAARTVHAGLWKVCQ